MAEKRALEGLIASCRATVPGGDSHTSRGGGGGNGGSEEEANDVYSSLTTFNALLQRRYLSVSSTGAEMDGYRYVLQGMSEAARPWAVAEVAASLSRGLVELLTVRYGKSVRSDFAAEMLKAMATDFEENCYTITASGGGGGSGNSEVDSLALVPGTGEDTGVSDALVRLCEAEGRESFMHTRMFAWCEAYRSFCLAVCQALQREIVSASGSPAEGAEWSEHTCRELVDNEYFNYFTQRLFQAQYALFLCTENFLLFKQRANTADSSDRSEVELKLKDIQRDPQILVDLMRYSAITGSRNGSGPTSCAPLHIQRVTKITKSLLKRHTVSRKERSWVAGSYMYNILRQADTVIRKSAKKKSPVMPVKRTTAFHMARTVFTAYESVIQDEENRESSSSSSSGCGDASTKGWRKFLGELLETLDRYGANEGAMADQPRPLSQQASYAASVNELLAKHKSTTDQVPKLHWRFVLDNF